MTDHHEPVPLAPDGATWGTFAIPGDARPSLFRLPAAGDASLSPQLARLILDRRTTVGDVVIDVDDDIAFAAAAVRAGRRHHALGGAVHLAAMGHAAGYIDMILLRWPRPAVNAHWILIACQALLRHVGCLVVAVSVEREQRVAHLSSLSGAASTAGLRVVDHIAVFDPADETATPVAIPSRARRLARRRGLPEAADAAAGAAQFPHTDLLVFTSEAAPR